MPDADHHHAPVESGTQAEHWDARYQERDGKMWSGRPNGRLVAETSALEPGRALDVGCGEGADAIWLATRGWEVTAIDVSSVAIERARAAAEEVGTSVEWIAGDVLARPLDAGSFDLVSLQYPALPKAAGEASIRALLQSVRHGGLLLAVYHDLDDHHREHMKTRGIDPAEYVGADDLRGVTGRRVHHRAPLGRASGRSSAGHPSHRRCGPARPAELTSGLGHLDV